MAAFLMNGFSWNMGYRAVGALQLCLAAALFAALPLWQAANGRKSAEQKDGADERPAAGFVRVASIPGVKQTLFAFFCYCAVELTAGLWGASYLVAARGIKAETAAQWISLFYGGITAGRFLSGFLSMKLSNRNMTRLGLALTAAGVAGLIPPLGNAVLLGAFFLMGLGCAPVFPSLIHETPNSFGAEHSQTVIGLQMASAYLGNMLMPPLFGWLAARAGFGLFPWCMGGAVILLFAALESANRTIDRARRDTALTAA
jgi:fucose permease